MLWWALLFLFLALIATMLGYQHLAHTSTQIAYLFIAFFIIILAIALTYKLIGFVW